MVDRGIFLSMSGAKGSMQQLGIISNNLANANTIGFRADYEAIKSDQSTQKSTRSYSLPERTYSDFRSGPMSVTGRALDVAVEGPGFIAVQTKEGKEAYTRAGNLDINAQGFLVTARGDLVLGTSGILSIPKAQSLTIDRVGQVAVVGQGESNKDLAVVGQIKLVDVPVDQLQKGADGLFHIIGDGNAKESKTVRLAPETLEGSNVNTVKSMVDLIDLSRQFEMHSRLIKSLEDNTARSNQLLDITK
ncbi:MAG: flagellar basal body rod protein FlgF [Legionellales bacterium]